MSLPVYLQSFKAAGVYRVVFDKSTVLNQDSSILRMVVGYSEKGPFNTPTYVANLQDFRTLYGTSTKLQEKRGNYFHRISEQCLQTGPIICLNLKKFDTEKVVGAQIDTNFNAKDPIDTVEIPVEDIYDTTRFWTLSADKLNEVRGAEYINIATTNTKATSGTFFIRKASGNKVSGYNITVRDWYSDATSNSNNEEMPEYLQGYENELMSAFFAEVYVFGGKFTADQVLASDTLKNYFIVGTDGKLKLRQYVKDSFGEYQDTLDYLYEDETSGAIGHYVGCLIPYFKDKNGTYQALDIVFNQDQDVHNMMMSFNVDMLEEDGTANIDLSGARYISTNTSIPDNVHQDKANGHELANEYKQYGTRVMCIKDLWSGTAKTTVLGNLNAPVVSDRIEFTNSLYDEDDVLKASLSYKNKKKITGYLYINSYSESEIVLRAVGSEDTIKIDLSNIKFDKGVDDDDFKYILYKLGAAVKYTEASDDNSEIVTKYKVYDSGLGTIYKGTDAYDEPTNIKGPKAVITSIGRDLDSDDDAVVVLSSATIKCNTTDVYITNKKHYLNSDLLIDADDDSQSWAVYGSSVSFIPVDDCWNIVADQDEQLSADTEDLVHTYTISTNASNDQSILAMLEVGDQFLAVDASVDMDGDGDYDDEKQNGFYDLCYVQETGTKVDEVTGMPTKYYVKFTGNLATYDEKINANEKDQIITDAEYQLLSDTQKAEYQPYEYSVSYHKVAEKTVSAQTYNNLADSVKDGFDVSSITFSKQVNALEYVLLNADAQALCTQNFVKNDATGEVTYLPSYTFVYDKYKTVYSSEEEAQAARSNIEGARGIAKVFGKSNESDLTAEIQKAQESVTAYQELVDAATVDRDNIQNSLTEAENGLNNLGDDATEEDKALGEQLIKELSDSLEQAENTLKSAEEDKQDAENKLADLKKQLEDSNTPIGWVVITVNDDIKFENGSTDTEYKITVDLAGLEYGGNDYTGYVATKYTDPEYDYGTVIETLTAEEFEKIRPIAPGTDEGQWDYADDKDGNNRGPGKAFEVAKDSYNEAVVNLSNTTGKTDTEIKALQEAYNKAEIAYNKAKAEVLKYDVVLTESVNADKTITATLNYEAKAYTHGVDGKNLSETSDETGIYLAGMKDLHYTVARWYIPADPNAMKNQSFIVRVERGLNQEIGTMSPVYLKGYTYEHPKPDGTGQKAKLDWLNYQLSALTEYKGLRTGLLSKAEIDYRYIIDGFESFVESGCKKVLSYLAKEKQSAFAILNFPAVKTFVKCPYTSFTDAKGVFNVQYVVDGRNKKKAATTKFDLPSNDEGASFCAFYTPLKFSDGSVDSVIPSAGLVSNIFMEKYASRHPYDIVAGPTYSTISASGLIGPDYHYSQDELNLIEPYGVNCMVYRPSFGTFINANQTAKQTPKSALSSVNVRELVIYLMDEIEKVLQSYQWEFNNQTIRNKIKDKADAICAQVAANGGLQAYLNVMDESNNTDEIIDNEMAILSTHIEPGRGMGKMVHELTLYRTGQMSSYIQGE